MSTVLTLVDALQTPFWLLAQVTEPVPEMGLVDKLLNHRLLSHPMALVFAFLTTIILVPSLAGMWVSMRTKEWEASLKLAMLERGMSAQEIQMVLDAGSGRGRGHKKGCMKSVRDDLANCSQPADFGSQPNT
jgi:hypothetical protein